MFLTIIRFQPRLDEANAVSGNQEEYADFINRQRVQIAPRAHEQSLDLCIGHRRAEVLRALPIPPAVISTHALH